MYSTCEKGTALLVVPPAHKFAGTAYIICADVTTVIEELDNADERPEPRGHVDQAFFYLPRIRFNTLFYLTILKSGRLVQKTGASERQCVRIFLSKLISIW